MAEPPISPVDLTTAPRYLWGAGCEGWHLVATPELSVIRERMPAGSSEVRHRHQRAQQFFFVLAGRLTIEVEGGERELDAGVGLQIPAGAAHQVFNRGIAPAEFLVVSQPRSHGDREAVPPASSETAAGTGREPRLDPDPAAARRLPPLAAAPNRSPDPKENP